MKNLTAELETLKAQDMYRHIPQIEEQGKWIREFDRPPMLNLCSNDYLGIIDRQDLIREFYNRMQQNPYINAQQNPYINAQQSPYPNPQQNLHPSVQQNLHPDIQPFHLPHFSAASSRLLTGNSSSYNKLEQLLCEKFNKEAALVFNSGYHANIGILPALCDKETMIIADKLVHASIIDGIKLSGCKFERFRHNDCNHLETILKKEQHHYKHLFIVTESIFSMGGDEAPLKEIVELKKKYPQITLYLDEAHAFGVCGATGLGCTEKYDLIQDVDILVATLGKAVSSVGAFIVCNTAIKNYLVNKMRSFIFSTALPPINIEWSRFIIEKLPIFTAERRNLYSTSKYLKERLKCEYSQSQIVTYTTADAQKAVQLSGKLKESGFYALPVRPPTVPPKDIGIRFSLTASITMQEIEAVAKIILTT
ncbi:MAG: 8-amino-7-oxononanoate synthase [Bacteroidales bacterium]